MGSTSSLATLLFLAVAGPALALEECGSLDNAYGPYDYWTAKPEQRSIVERHHLTEDVLTLRRGATSTRVGGDLDYTLRAFPNHPRALAAMAELGFRTKSTKPAGSRYTVECWFERAIRFRPKDGMVRAIFGVALLKAGKRDDAIRTLTLADELLPNNANVLYNLGLAYAEAKDYDRAVVYAKRAYDLGFTLPGLREMLQKAGKWP